MVAPNREIVNISHLLTTLAITNPEEAKCILEDINIDKPRSRSTFSSKIMSRAISAQSDVLSIPYVKHMEVQSNNSS